MHRLSRVLSTISVALVSVTFASTGLAAAASSKPLPSYRTTPLNRNAASLSKSAVTSASTNTGAVVYGISWSGYYDGANTYNEVSGSITVPTVVCTAADYTAGSATAFWIGLDGATDPVVEQDGVLATCSGNKVVYNAFWETAPANTEQIISSSLLTLKPGDTVNMDVKFVSGTTYQFTLSDATTKQTYHTTGTCGAGTGSGTTTCPRSSAEWIAERPGNGSGWSNLLDWNPISTQNPWGLVYFNNDYASTSAKPTTMQAVGSFTNYPVFMDNRFDNSATLAEIQAKSPVLATTDTSFPIIWLAEN